MMGHYSVKLKDTLLYQGTWLGQAKGDCYIKLKDSSVTALKPEGHCYVKLLALKPEGHCYVKPLALKPDGHCYVKPLALKPEGPCYVKPLALKPEGPCYVKPRGHCSQARRTLLC